MSEQLNEAEASAESSEEAGEYYIDKVSGKRRRVRGSRKQSHGPMSGAEKNMSRTFQAMLRDLHWMDGELSDAVCVWMTAQLAAYRLVLRDYQYSVCPDPTAEDLSRLLEQLGVPDLANASVPVEDVDVYRDLR